MSELKFEWDPDKASSNVRKHSGSFEEAKTVFDDPNVLIKPDLEHSEFEERAHAIGLSARSRLLLVVVAERYEDVISIISARRPTPREKKAYREAQRP